MSAPSCLRILAASAVMLGAIVFVIVDTQYMSAPTSVQKELPVKGDSLLQAAAVSKTAVNCKVSESQPHEPRVEGSESMFYMESLIPLLGFAFCIPLKRLWLSLQDSQNAGDDEKQQVATGVVASSVAQTDAAPIALDTALPPVDDSLAGVFREARVAFQEPLDELDQDLSVVPVTFTSSRVKEVADSHSLASLDWTALADAAKQGDASAFLEMTAEFGPNVQDAWGVSLLHMAALSGSETIMDSLLQRGADHSCTDLWEDTPLHYAARGGCLGVCQLLLDAGAKSSKNAQDWTPLLVAAHAGKEEACKLFLDAGFEVGAADCELPPLLHCLFVDKLIADLPRTPVLAKIDELEDVPSDLLGNEFASEE